MALLIVIVFIAIVGEAVVNSQSLGQALLMLIFVPSGILGFL